MSGHLGVSDCLCKRLASVRFDPNYSASGGETEMPGQRCAVDRAGTTEERAAMGDTPTAFGNTTFDIYVNGGASWRNGPATV